MFKKKKRVKWLCCFIFPPSSQLSSERLDEDSMISLAISAHYLFGDDQHTPELGLFLRQFPDWAFATSWVSTYHMYLY